MLNFDLDDIAAMTANLLFGEPYEADEDSCISILMNAFNEIGDDTLGAIVYMIKQHPDYTPDLQNSFIVKVNEVITEMYADDDQDDDPDHARDLGFDRMIYMTAQHDNFS